ncbi:MAG: hypothetical protein KIH01_00045 [Candidatus Freyarchaeota archaeon]|nr:hypothetical protein [Candidatus Jordarchaeia archaeon]
MTYHCAVVNCGKVLEEKESIELNGEKYCKECATLIMRDIVARLMGET